MLEQRNSVPSGIVKGPLSVARFFSPQLKRLLSYVRPYRFRMFVGVVLLAFVAMAEGLIALIIAPIFDRVLNPAASDSRLALFRVPFSDRTIYLNQFFPSSIHKVWPVGKLGRRIRSSVANSQDRLGELSQILQETVSGNRVVKAFGMEDFEIGKFRVAARRLLRETMRWVRAYALSSPLMDLLQPVVIALLLLYARQRIRLHDLTLGLFVAFVYALFQSYEPVKRMGSIYQQFQQAQGATTQVFSYLDMAEEQHHAPNARPPLDSFRKIMSDRVTFSSNR